MVRLAALFIAAHALRPRKDVREFYRTQGANYDGFREALLPDRDTLLKHCLPWASRPATWLSVGCGTARDLEYVVEHVRACGTRVFLLDLSPELLEMATARVNALGLQGQVTLLEADVTCYAENPPAGSGIAPVGPGSKDAYATRDFASGPGLGPELTWTHGSGGFAVYATTVAK